MSMFYIYSIHISIYYYIFVMYGKKTISLFCFRSRCACVVNFVVQVWLSGHNHTSLPNVFHSITFSLLYSSVEIYVNMPKDKQFILFNLISFFLILIFPNLLHLHNICLLGLTRRTISQSN